MATRTAPDALICLERPDGCRGPVELRWPGYGERSWPRCQRHGDARVARVAREQTAIGRYPDHRPSEFDELDAGERWEEDDY